MIKPSIGRVVWFYKNGKTQRDIGGQPNAALIAFVHSDSCINIGYFDANGIAQSETSVQLEQEPGDSDWSSSFCAWMPYQVGQAKAQAEREAKS